MSDRTALYRYFDADGKLLYVGISLSPVARQAQHRNTSSWYSRIASMTVQWFDTRSEACESEKAAIATEKPERNIAHRNREWTEHGKVPARRESCPWPTETLRPVGLSGRRLLQLIYDEGATVPNTFGGLSFDVRDAITFVEGKEPQLMREAAMRLRDNLRSLFYTGVDGEECRTCSHWMGSLIGGWGMSFNAGKEPYAWFAPSQLMTSLINQFSSYDEFCYEVLWS